MGRKRKRSAKQTGDEGVENDQDKKQSKIAKVEEEEQDDTATSRNKASHTMDFEIPILFQNNEIVIINKPHDLCFAGNFKYSVLKLMNHRYRESLIDGIRGYNRKFRPVHVLDYETSGALCLAMTQNAAFVITRAFEKHMIQKYYFAIVYGRVNITQVNESLKDKLLLSESNVKIDEPDDTTITIRTFIQNDETKDYFTKLEQYECTDPERQGKESVSQFKVLEYGTYKGREVTKILIKLHTGRRHQIRLHCSFIGHPIVGDTIYTSDLTADRMMLHAYSIAIRVPKNSAHLRKKNVYSAIADDPLGQYIEAREIVSPLDTLEWLKRPDIQTQTGDQQPVLQEATETELQSL